MKKKIKVSIIIPVYNAEKYLKKCLNSVLNQTLKEIEIICVNDGSTDNSKLILNEYSKRYKNIIIINQKNMGVDIARSEGFKIASGEYIAWVDNDDFINEKMYEKMYLSAKKNDSDIVICNYNFYPKDNTKKVKWFNEYKGIVDQAFLSRNALLWNKIVKKKLLDKCDVIDLFYRFSEAGYILVMLSTNKYSTINECLYNYRVGHVSVSSNYNNIGWYKKVVEKNYDRYNYIVEKNYNNNWKKFFFYSYLYYVLILMIISAYNQNKYEYKKCKMIIKKNGLFNGEYNSYLYDDFSIIKVLFFKYICVNSYTLTYISSKIVLK